jgi:hypothetical protein
MSIRHVVPGALVFLAACGAPNSPSSAAAVSPTPVSAPVPAPPEPTVSGIVAEGARPVEGAQIDNGYGPGAWVFSDASGAFTLPTNRSVDPYNFVRASKSGYAQPCAAAITGTSPVSVQLVSLAALDGTMLPSPPGLRTISGVVVTMTGTGKQPVAGAWVDFEPDPDNDWPAAVTYTNAKGEFALCALPQSALNIAAVFYTGFAYAIVPPGQTTIELMLHQRAPNGNHR